MGYCKKWIPPTIPLRDDLPAWKLLFNDLHQNLLDSGLAQTDAPGQLVIDDVSELPADGTFAGFVEYAFVDALQAEAPVIIRLEYGSGWEGLGAGSSRRRTRTPRIRCTVSFKGTGSTTFQTPQSYNLAGGLGNLQLTNAGMSYLCNAPEAGFLGVVYGAGSRNKPMAHTTGSYYGSTFSLFLQRTVDVAGTPTGEGLAIYYADLGAQNTSDLWDLGTLQSSYSTFLTAEGVASPPDNSLALRLGGVAHPSAGGQVQVQQVYYAAPHLRPHPHLATYVASVIPEGTEFEIEVYPGTTTNFIALGNETCISIDPLVGQRAALAMLFE